MPIITIVAKTGLLIETRVIHMVRFLDRASARDLRPAGRRRRSRRRNRDGALTIAGAPSFRLSKRAAEHRRIRRQRRLDLDAPGSSSRRPVTTPRLTSLPSSIVQTNVCPASVRTAVAGNVRHRRARARARCGRWRTFRRAARRRDCGMPTKTRIARVPGSVDGLIRSTRPVKCRSPKPSIESSTALPIASSGMSTAGTSACSSISLRSTMVTSGDVERDFLAGLHVPFRDDSGQRRRDDRVLQRVRRKLDLRLRRLDAAAATTSKLDYGIVERILRDEVLVQERLVGRLRLVGHRELRFRRFERARALDQLRLEVGGVDARQQLALARTDSPSRTVIWRTSPDTFALTVAWRTGCNAPETGSQRAIALRFDLRQVRRQKFEHNGRLGGLFPLGFAEFLGDSDRRRYRRWPPESPARRRCRSRAALSIAWSCQPPEGVRPMWQPPWTEPARGIRPTAKRFPRWMRRERIIRIRKDA